MKEINYSEYAKETLDILAKGAFLTTQADGKLNTMTIAWGCIGNMWGKPTFMVMVRQSRFTLEIINKTDEFTVTIPQEDLKKALALCGTKSGREMDKFAEADLKTRPAQKIGTPVLDCAGIHYECKIVYRQTMDPKGLIPDLDNKWYDEAHGHQDYHTLYYGEIISSYVTE